MRLILISSLFLIPLALSGCSDPNDLFIQGSWQRGDVHFYDIWTFDRGHFSHETSITMVNPQLVTGRYTVLDSQENEITLELFDLTGAFSDERQGIKIEISREADTVQIRGRTYERAIP